MLVLGLSLGHDVAAALVQSGRVIAAVQEERLSRVKLHPGFPYLAIDEVLQTASVPPDDIGAVAIGWDRDFLYETYDTLREGFQYLDLAAISGPLSRVILACLAQPATDTRWRSQQVEQVIDAILAEYNLRDKPRYYVGHHLAHAAGAYYVSPWDQALVVTSDGKGGGLSATISTAQADKLHRIGATTDLHSVGNFYAAVTRYLGYRANRHEGKITGLAAFGDPAANLETCGNVIRYDPSTKSIVNSLHRHYPDPGSAAEQAFLHEQITPFFSLKNLPTIKSILDSTGHVRRFRLGYVLFKNYFDRHLAGKEPPDVAAFAQELLERVVVAQVKDVLTEHPHKYICLAGGIFANVKLNQRLREIAGVENVFIYPAMGDAGTAVGAALYVCFNQPPFCDTVERHIITTVYHGREYSDRQIEQILAAGSFAYKHIDDIAPLLARLIHAGKVIGYFDGAMEWGPRALGSRSILVRATDKNINTELNRRLRRTEFMPFAPSILAEHAGDYFKGYRPDHLAARFMTITYDIFPEKTKLCPAVVHVDNTARPQVVFKEDNPRYHRLLTEYHQVSQLPIFINTSFNIHEEPIVRSPQDALRCLAGGAIDLLALGNFLVTNSTHDVFTEICANASLTNNDICRCETTAAQNQL